MPKRLLWLDEKKDEIIKMYMSSVIQDDIAKYFNVSRASISRRLLKWGLTDHWNKIDIDANKLYCLYYDKKLSEQAIANFYHCTVSMIHRRMVKFGIKRRSYSDCKKGYLNPFYGRKHSEEAKLNMSLSFKNGRRIVGSNMYGVGTYYNTPNQGRKWMRSGWEVKAANYLTDQHIDWYYEYKWLHLENDRYYLPDFYLPIEDKYIEIKGVSFDGTTEKLNLACKIYNIDIWNRNKLIKLGIINSSGS